MRTMLISRLNGVAWYHDAKTISQQCEMQVICLVERCLRPFWANRPDLIPKARPASLREALRAGMTGLSPGFQPRESIPKIGRPNRAVEFVLGIGYQTKSCNQLPTDPSASPTRDAGAMRTWPSTPSLHHSITPARNASRSDAGGPSLRAARFEDEDSLPDEASGLQASNFSG